MGGGGYAGVQVNSEQVSLESFAEAGERLCCPNIWILKTEIGLAGV